MTDPLDTLRPEVRRAIESLDVRADEDWSEYFIIRGELLRLAGECAMIPRAQLLANFAAANERAEKAEAELAALKARIADGWLCGVSNDACPGNFDAAIYCLPSRFRGKRVRLVVEE